MNIDKIQKIALDGELFTAEQFQQHRSRWLAGGGSVDDSVGFVRDLNQRGELTDFQASALRAGVPGP